MNTIETTQPITLDDGAYDFLAKRGTMVRLRHTATGEQVDITLAELARRTVGMHSTSAPAPRVLDTLASTQRSKTLMWATHIKEILTGERDGCDIPDPRYSLERTQEERIASKIEELNQVGERTSRATVMRYINRYRADGTMGLVDRRSQRRHGPLDLIDARVHDALCFIMAAQQFQSTGTKSRLIRTTHEELLRRHGAEGPSMPSTASMYRYIDVLDAGRHTTGSAKTRRSNMQRPNRTFAKASALLPGSEVQVDSTTMDVFVKTSKGPQRPILTIAIDVRSRTILAATIRLEATKSVDHVTLLLQILTPPQSRPDRLTHRRLVREANPHIAFLDDAESEALRATRPFIYPRRVMMDNGKDYVGGTFRAALEKFGIDISLSAPHTPTDKSIVERTFGSINTMFTQYLPGYTGRSPEFRGLAIEKQDLMSAEAIYELFDDWVAGVWQNRPHGSLVDPFEPSIKYSPNQVVTAAEELTSTLYLPLTTDDYIELLPTKFRTITATGVTMAHRQYDSVELHPLRNTKSRLANQDRKWEVKFDPYNTQVVWVRSNDNTWIECRNREEAAGYRPFSDNMTEPTEREDLARSNAELNGVAIHQEPLVPQLLTLGSFLDDDDYEDPTITAFDPSKD